MENTQKHMRILVIGGVAAGASAATKARRSNEAAEIILFEKGEYVSFANCGLPYYVGDVITDRDELLLVTPELFRDRFNIDVRLNNEVVDIDPANKTITVKSGENITNENYDKLILATGGKPVVPDISGVNLRNVHLLFTVPDADAVMTALSDGINTATVIGGGFIGIETAENLAMRGIKTVLVEKAERLMGNMDSEFSSAIAERLMHCGIDVRLNSGIKEITGNQSVSGIILDDNTEIACDLVILAIGVLPGTELAHKAGLSLGVTRGVLVDETMLTSDPNIYAAGDMVETVHMVSGKKVRIPLAGSANKQGRVAGANAAGKSMRFNGVMGTSIIKIFDIVAARTGLSESEAKSAGISCRSLYIPGNSNATYYPDAESMVIKLTFEIQNGKLLGAQILGGKGTDKRIDIFATAIYAGLTVFDLENLDLAYAPPFSSAKDPVIISGMVASNMLRGEIAYILPSELKLQVEAGDSIILDVRTEEEVSSGCIPEAINIPVDEIRKRVAELDITKKYIVYCAVGYRAYNACLFLQSRGFSVLNLSGGYRAYMLHK